MTRARFSLGVAAAFALLGAVACGDDGTGGSGATGATGTGGETAGGAGGAATGGNSSGGAGGMVAFIIPDPGPGMDGEWIDTEPNDTPDHAVPMGTQTGPIWAGFMEPYTAINPETDVDYFVFKTGADVTNINMQLCWSFAGNLLDMNLYEVVDQKQGMLVKSSASTAASCETLIDFGGATGTLTPNTTYLLEVAGAPGLVLNGDPGLYSA
ncbi:MAG: hypothetical protein U0271_36400 [Polyangiaceae bacterium]